jgi:cytochrome c-type biogenesis protein CcmH/NrfG
MKRWVGALVLLGAGLCFGDSLSEALQSRRFQDAVALADTLLESQPRDPRIWTARAVALGGLGRDQESLSSFEKALSFAPKFVPALKGAVEVSYRLHDGRTAALLDRLLALDPRNGVAHAMAGVLAFEADNCAAAVSHF